MKFNLGAWIVGGFLLFGLILGMASMKTIEPGYVGIIYSMNGGVKKEVLGQGVHFINPMHKVKEYSVSTEQAFLSRDKREGSSDDDSFNIPTSDGKTVNVDLEFSYHFDAEVLPNTYTRFKGQDGKTIEQTFIRGKMKAWTSEVSSTFSVIDIYGEKRAALNAQVFEHVKGKFNEYGIVIDSVNFSRIDLDAQTAKAIQAKINAQQALEQAKIERDKAKIEADKKREIARGESDAKVIYAEGNAKAYDTMNKSISDGILKKMWIEKWDGKVSNVASQNNSGMFYNIK